MVTCKVQVGRNSYTRYFHSVPRVSDRVCIQGRWYAVARVLWPETIANRPHSEYDAELQLGLEERP